ncbi:LytTR family transcriptional regulator DNA-binding domain-containing protein [Lentibacillus sp. L22]
MTTLKIDQETTANHKLPKFSINIDSSQATAIYSDIDLQAELVKVLRENHDVKLFDYQEGLYERLTVQGNIKFFHQWFNCQTPLAEILVMFQLTNCAKTALRKCSTSEIRRVFYAKHYMAGANLNVFREPIHGVDVLTINTFIKMLKQMAQESKQVLLLVSNMEHALLLGDIAYRLQDQGLHELETETQEEQKAAEETPISLTVEKMFKVPAKVDDKVILFDPTEIDYIESQDGKSSIVINNESFALDSTLTEIEQKLELYGFYRCHRSYIVNLQKVREIIT